jgi:hypothetical protein
MAVVVEPVLQEMDLLEATSVARAVTAVTAVMQLQMHYLVSQIFTVVEEVEEAHPIQTPMKLMALGAAAETQWAVAEEGETVSNLQPVQAIPVLVAAVAVGGLLVAMSSVQVRQVLMEQLSSSTQSRLQLSIAFLSQQTAESTTPTKLVMLFR